VYAPSIKAYTFGDDIGQQDVKLMAHHAPLNILQSKHYVQIMMACVNREWLTTTTSSALGFWLINADNEDDSVCSDYACNSLGLCSCNSTHDDYEQNNTYGTADESVCLMASFENRTTMQARKAWRGQNGQFGKTRGYHKHGADNVPNNTFVHNRGGYDYETFIFQQLFSAGIEPNPGPDGVILSATDGEGNATSTCEGGSSRSAPTAPPNIVQRKRSRSSMAAVAEEREIQRTMDDEQSRKVQSARLLAQENRM
jgi:hypothetical protein